MKAIGTMSGTSIDGVDVALIETDGERILSLGPSGYRPYSDDERATLRQALTDAVQMTTRARRARGGRTPCYRRASRRGGAVRRCAWARGR
jgi:1,6-anhydro-N-acetylmuramate kinase